MKNCFCFITLVTSLVFSQANAQEVSFLDSVNFYGSFRAHLAVFDQTVEMQNNASRIGCYLKRGVYKGITAEAKIELGTNLIKNNNSFNPDAATKPDPASFLTETTPAITTRLGYVGLSKIKWGTLLIGKQWGVYYDVSVFTDYYNVFGASASGTYNTGTDGGGEGTGRAESAFTYRNKWNNLALGLQVQFPGSDYNFGGSIRYSLPKGITVGVAYNYYDVPDNVLDVVVNAKKSANSVVAAVKYESKKSYVALCYGYNESEVQYTNPKTAAGFSANGFELYAHHFFTPDFKISAGVNYLLPVGSPDSLPSSYSIFYFPIGAEYYFINDFLCYAEIKLDAGITATGTSGKNVFVLGLKYNFNLGHGRLKLGSKK